MLRALVVALLVANGLFFLWSQGWLDGVVGVRARGDREPERLAAQVRPESVIVLKSPPTSASTPAASRSAIATVAPAGAALVAAAPDCLEAGPFTAAELDAAEAALRAALPGATWSTVRSEKPAAWIVYMGAYPDRDTMLRKEQELSRVRESLEEVALPSEGPYGLSLGRYPTRSAAERALAQYQERGIRTARVLQGSPPAVLQLLRFERAEPALAAQLTTLRAEALGKGFVACAPSEAAR